MTGAVARQRGPASGALTTAPVTPDRWDDLCALSGPSGAYSGCWCMWWRVTGAEFSARSGAGLREDLRALVAGGREPGLLAYRDGEPVGWCAVAPRADYGRILRSPKLKPTDDREGVWSITCFFIDRAHRGSGVATALLDAAEAFAFARGASAVEAYPIDPAAGRADNASAFTGLLGMFRDAGYQEVARRGGRPTVRKDAPGNAASRGGEA